MNPYYPVRVLRGSGDMHPRGPSGVVPSNEAPEPLAYPVGDQGACHPFLCHLFMWTSSMETSAGVTPGIREACPTEAGRHRESFSTASFRMPESRE